MPSHQARREPLPASYRFGDMGRPRPPYHVTVSRSVYSLLIRMLWTYNHAHMATAPVMRDTTPYTIQLNDTVFHQGDY